MRASSWNPIGRRPAPRGPALTLFALTLAVLGCSQSSASGNPPVTTPTPATPRALQSPTPEPTATAVATATPPPTATPQLAAGEAMIVGGEVRVREEPNTRSQIIDTLHDLDRVTIARRVKGENWLRGDQDWVQVDAKWASEWFELESGGYLYGPFVFILKEGEVPPTAPAGAEEKWVDIDISEQVAQAMVGDKVVFEAPISSGAPPFDTPQGSLAIEPDGRIVVERMTASQAGYGQEVAQYDVERVLFTQYFDRNGNALHLNYWRPHSVFGSTPTSHGCVGLELHEAQYFWLFAEAGTRIEIND